MGYWKWIFKGINSYIKSKHFLPTSFYFSGIIVSVILGGYVAFNINSVLGTFIIVGGIIFSISYAVYLLEESKQEL